MGFVHSSSAMLSAGRALVQRLGLALIGGDFTGNSRGQYSVDLQGTRDRVWAVASGDHAVAVGNSNEASGISAIAIGDGCVASGRSAVAMGSTPNASADYAAAFGVGMTAEGEHSLALGAAGGALGAGSVAIGFGSWARVDWTAVLPPLCGQVGDVAGSADWFRVLAGADVILRMGWIDAKVVSDYTLFFPLGCRFWVNDLGLIVSDVSGLTAQPFIHFGITGFGQNYVANVQTTALTGMGRRQVFSPAVSGDGEQSLTFGIVTAATGTRLMVSPYWRGVLMESS
jgi:hypothetical protein